MRVGHHLGHHYILCGRGLVPPHRARVGDVYHPAGLGSGDV